VAEVIGVHEDFIWALDESVADMSIESLPIVVRLKMPFLKVFMQSFREEFKDFSKLILREPEFALIYLKPIVEEFYHMMTGDTLSNDKEDAIADIICLKWKGQKDDILMWYKALKKAEKETAAEEKKIAELTKKKLK
jgi:hypothetical protein